MEERALDKKFGFMLSAVSIILAAYLYKIDGDLALILVLVAASTIFIYMALLAPQILSPFAKRWIQFGMLLNKIISPFILAIVFFGVITPLAFFFKALGKDPLRLKWDSKCSTYWIKRITPGPLPPEMEDPF